MVQLQTLAVLATLASCRAFLPILPSTTQPTRRPATPVYTATDANDCDEQSRRDLLISACALSLALTRPDVSHAAVGTLPEFAETNAILRGITVKVADKSQQDAMIKFMQDSFDCEIQRKRIRGTIEETWVGFGPEQVSIPDDFEMAVSSFAAYGGHASIRIVYDSKTVAPLYRVGDTAPGTNIAYLQLAVPGYRVSQMVANGGNVLDAYGYVNVVSPSGLPIRSIVGIWPDPIMFVAINTADVKASKAFYEQLGFVEQDYPYARPSRGQGQFEPLMPKNSVYMAPSPNCMGVLLLPMAKRKLSINPVVDSLDIVYAPSVDVVVGEDIPNVVDPSGVALSFQSVEIFTVEEKETR
jgi:hypothetical protein